MKTMTKMIKKVMNRISNNNALLPTGMLPANVFEHQR